MNPDLEDYIEAHISPEPAFLKDIDRETNLCQLNGRMCSGHIQGRLLKMLTQMISPEKVIELGTFTGYSALCVAEGLKEGAEIHTIEIDDELEDIIRSNLSKSPHGNKVRPLTGDALTLLKRYEDNFFDMALIDADKREYPRYLEEILRVIRPGGFILADNTLWDGHVTETVKHSTQTSGIMEFNDLVAQNPGLEVAMIPVRDGLTLIRKLN